MIETNRIFLQKDGVNLIAMPFKIRTQSDRKSKKRGHYIGTFLPSPSIGVSPQVLYPQDTDSIAQYAKLSARRVRYISSISFSC